MARVRSSEQPAGCPWRIGTIVLLHNQPPASTHQSSHKRAELGEEKKEKRATIFAHWPCAASYGQVLRSFMCNTLRKKKCREPLIIPEACRRRSTRLQKWSSCNENIMQNSSVICYLTSDSDSHVVAQPRVRRNKSERNARRTAADLSAHDPSGVHAQTHTRARDVKLPQRKQGTAAERSGLIC